jgi:hypothetical protein
MPVLVLMKKGSDPEIPERVKAILGSKDLTLHQVSRRSAVLFGRRSRCYLPHNLYYDVQGGIFSPSIFQLFALSRISNYSLFDWLRVFGFAVEAIPRLQIQLPSARTILLDPSLDDPNSLIPWLRHSRSSILPPSVAPLSHMLEWTEPQRLGALANLKHRGFLYAKIGYQDALAFPELLAGSIVRINPTMTDELPIGNKSGLSKRLFLVEHANGFFCCHVRVVGNDRIAVVSTQLPYPQPEFKLPQEAKLLGVADLEIRNLQDPRPPRLAREVAKNREPGPTDSSPPKLGSLLRHARIRIGLSFRSASAISRQIANLLADARYFGSPGSLSDYEALDVPPRHFHKIITFCVIYSLRLDSILETLGLSPQDAGGEPIPDIFMDRASSVDVHIRSVDTDGSEHDHVLKQLLGQLKEIPFFLRGSIGCLSGLTNPSLRDCFWIGGVTNHRHAYLAGGLLVLVNRHRKKPDDCDTKPSWQQPLYVILRRDGTYQCGCCEFRDKHLVVHSYINGFDETEMLEANDAEIVGQIVTVLRTLA